MIFFVCVIKFIYSEKATKFCEISNVNSSYVVPVKSTVEISKKIVAFSEYMNFNKHPTFEKQSSFPPLLLNQQKKTKFRCVSLIVLHFSSFLQLFFFWKLYIMSFSTLYTLCNILCLSCNNRRQTESQVCFFDS